MNPMSLEKTFVKQIQRGLKGRVKFTRHEDSYSVGIPDLSYDMEGMVGSGWVEMKALKAWPKRPTTVVKIKHYSPQQKTWILSRGILNDRTFLFLRVDKDYLLFDWKGAQKVGTLTKEEMFIVATASWRGKLNYFELQSELKGKWR